MILYSALKTKRIITTTFYLVSLLFKIHPSHSYRMILEKCCFATEHVVLFKNLRYIHICYRIKC